MGGMNLIDPSDPIQGLTPKQERAALLHAAGLDKTAAYTQAYNVTTDNKVTISQTAHQVFSNPKVKFRVAQLRKEAAMAISHSALDLKNFVLAGLVELAATAKSEAVRRQAYETLGKTNVVNLFKDETGDDPSKMADADLEKKLETTLRKVLDKVRVINPRT
jgi:hypothetical protein